MTNRILLLTLLFASSIGISQTNVSGGIFDNTTWSLANSPYIVTGELVLYADKTLTIEPGVEVKFNQSKKFRVQGNLKAIGTASDSIYFSANTTSNSRAFWEHIYVEWQGSFQFDYVNISNAEEGLHIGHIEDHDSCYIRHSNFSYNTEGISRNGGGNFGIPISDTRFHHNDDAIRFIEELELTNCDFQYNISGGTIWQSSFDNCTFKNNELGMTGSENTITNCTFQNNGTGLAQSFSGGSTASVMTNNTIIYNEIGLLIGGNSPSATFKNNVVCHNSSYNVELQSSYSGHDLSQNCWCLTDEEELQTSMYDARDNLSLGLLSYLPLGDCPVEIGIQELSIQDALRIYPVPTSESLFIEDANNYEYEIYDAQGRLRVQGTTSGEINTSELSKGLYSIQIKEDRRLISVNQFIVE